MDWNATHTAHCPKKPKISAKNPEHITDETDATVFVWFLSTFVWHKNRTYVYHALHPCHPVDRLGFCAEIGVIFGTVYTLMLVLLDDSL